MSGVPAGDGENGRSLDSAKPQADMTSNGMVAPMTTNAAMPRSMTFWPMQRRPWLLGALVCAATATMTFVLVFAMTSDASRPVSGSPIAAPAAASSPPAATTPERTFTQVPALCSLLRPTTVTKYLPGTTCSATSGQASWISKLPSTNGDFFSVYININLTSLSHTLYDGMKSRALSLFTDVTVTDSRPVADLGDEAYLIFGSGSVDSRAYLLLVDGNAEIMINYGGLLAGHGVSQEQSEASVIAMGHDIIGSLR
jgi:hypothetical protein